MLHSINSPLSSLLSSSPGPFTSCGAEERMIIQPTQEVLSFDWSDFPVICHNTDVELFPAPQPLQKNHDDVPPTSDDSTATSLSAQQEQEQQHHSSQDASTSSESVTPNNSQSNKKRVSFASSLEIRTHSVVLGDHPCCHGLPLQLGWEYDDTEYVCLDSFERNKLRVYRNKPIRLSYWDRKNILKRISGMTERDLADAAEEMQSVGSFLRHAAPVSTHLSTLML